jgi:hypothetical protein
MSKRAAKVISNVLSLPLVATSVILVFSFFSREGLGSLTPLTAALLGIPILAVAPIAMVLYFFRKGYVDLHVSKGERRPVFFVPALAAYSSAALVFLLFRCRIFYLLSVSYLLISLMILVITVFWKVSIHMAGLTGPVTALALALGSNYVLLYLLALPLGWARTELEAHTVPQVVLGAAVGAGITALVFIGMAQVLT